MECRTALYLPIQTEFTILAETECEVALCFSRAEEKFPARLITPDEVEVEIRGGANATRQINHILKPEFAAQRLLLVEVYTPSGNWSSYPPHKHDVHSPPEEVDLEELYYYKVDAPEGYAIQRVYTADGRIDQTLTVRDGELVLIPEGYHPVVAAHGYNVYYLNALAGSARSMAASDDPAYAWVRQAWTEQDPRVPLVSGGQRELMTDRDFDILSMGRSSIDLYANDIGAPFPEIKNFRRLCWRLSNQHQRRDAPFGNALGPADSGWGRPGRRFCASLP